MLFRRTTRGIAGWSTLAVLAAAVAGACYLYRPLHAPNDPTRRVPLLEAALADDGETPPQMSPPAQERAHRQTSEYSPKRLISGVVLNPDGSRASGAVIQAFLLRLGPMQYEEKHLFKTTTNDRGWFELPGLPVGSYAVAAQMRDASCLDFMPQFPAEFPRFYTIRMTPVCSVSGRIIDPKGESVPDAEVWLLQDQTLRENKFRGSADVGRFDRYLPFGEPVLTDGDGKFMIPFAARTTSRLLVSKAGYADFQSEDFQAPCDDLDVIIGRCGQLSGRVVDDETGEGISGIAVVALDENLVSSERAVSNHAGEFFFPHLRCGIHTLGCNDNEYTYVGDRGLSVRINENERLEGVELRVHRTVSVSGRVFNAETGEPFPGQRVQADRDAVDVTGERGEYVLDHVLPGRVSIRVYPEAASTASGASRIAHRTVLVMSGENSKTADISAHPVPILRGRTVDEEGQVVPYAAVGNGLDGAAMAVSDADGRFAFSGVHRTQKYSLWAQKADLVCVREQPVEIPALGEPPAVTLTLREGCRVTGQAVDSHGSPLSSVQLVLETHDLSRQYTTTGVDGAFLFVGVPAGEHQIEFGNLGPMANSKEVEDTRITFGCIGNEDVSGIRIVLPEKYFDRARLRTRGNHTIRGIVVGEDGRPLPNVGIEYFETGKGAITERIWGVAYTLHDGTFEIENLPLGRYYVNSYAGGWSFYWWGPSQKVAIPGLWPVRFTVLKGRQPGQITGHVFDKDTGKPITDFEIAMDGPIDDDSPSNFETGIRTLFHDEEGRFSMENYHFGDDVDTVLYAFAEGYAPGTINLGKTDFDSDIAGNDFHLEPEGVIQGTVTALDGSPLPGASVGYVEEGFSSIHEITRTRIDGTYRIGGMGDAEFQLGASHPIGAAQTKVARTEPGKTTRVDFVIDSGETHGD